MGRNIGKVFVQIGNNAGGWGDLPELPLIVGLLRDVDTCWSSIFSMIDRIIELYLVHFPFRLF
ncbi:hypothetical protein B0H10DRAFT_1804899 [Mycena sp. CBHHK59/15]|nr:hypothetical protein B0H10DRAFT_1804899 [Mycena sp. CBHHK59/15]